MSSTISFANSDSVTRHHASISSSGGGSLGGKQQRRQQPQYQHRASLRPFQIERYEGWLARSGNLSDSDCEPMPMSDLLKVADDECLRLWEELSLGYPFHVEGDPLLRSQIRTEFYPNNNFSPSGDIDNNDNIFVNCMAPQEGIFCTLQALLRSGDNVIVSGPAYQSLSEIPRSIGCNVTHWLPELIREENQQLTSYFRFDPDALRSMLQSTPNTKLVVVNFPHNPTGAFPTKGEWEEIVEHCRRAGCYLFCDEMYRYLEHDGIDRLESAVEIYEGGISLGGLSKSFGLAGLRMGWISSRDESLMERIQQIKDYTTICAAAPSQILSLIAVRNAPKLIQRCRRIVRDVKIEVEKFCRDHSNVLEWTDSRAGTFVFPKLRSHHSSSKLYCDRLLKDADIMLLPSSLFEYGEHDTDDSRVRISLGRKSIPETLTLWKSHGV